MTRRAFTLIELLITISIIVVLTGIATLSYTSIKLRSRDAQRKNDLNQIKIALSTYYNSQNPAQYVPSSGDPTPVKITITDTTDALTAALKPTYIKDIPLDPLNSGNNLYKYQSFLTGTVNTDFKLFGTLENLNDKNGWAGGSGWVTDGYIVQNE